MLRPSEKEYQFQLRLKSAAPEKDKLAQSYGTFEIGNQVLNARKIVKTIYVKEETTLNVILDIPK